MKAVIRLLVMLLLPFYAWSSDSGSGIRADDEAVVKPGQDVVVTTAPLIIESDPADDASGPIWDVHLMDGTRLEPTNMHDTRMRMFRIPETAITVSEVDGVRKSVFDVIIHGAREQKAGDDKAKNFEINKHGIAFAFTERIKIENNQASSQTLSLPEGSASLVRKTWLDDESEESTVILSMGSFDDTRKSLQCQTFPWFKNLFTGACYRGFGPIAPSFLWNNGLWNNGLWHSGLWHSGVWNNGLWNNGLWNNGLWHNGVLYPLVAMGMMLGANGLSGGFPALTSPQYDYVYSYYH